MRKTHPQTAVVSSGCPKHFLTLISPLIQQLLENEATNQFIYV